MKRAALVILTAGGLAASGWAGDVPVAVSPGSAEGALIGDTCPTFSWGGIEDATSYELVVYRVDREQDESEPILRQRFAGSVSSWTPPLELCLERAGRYAWSVRAAGGSEVSEWSPPSLFQVVARPSEAELEEALEVVRRYLGDRDAGAGDGSAPTRPAPGLGAPAPQALGGTPAALSAVHGDAALQVNGAPVVTTATLETGLCSALSWRFLDRGDGTVLDCNTGLLWLRDASCATLPGTDADGLASWGGALAAVAALGDGTCRLSDGSSPGDWRLPTRWEFCSTIPLGANVQCPAEAAADSLFDTSLPPGVAVPDSQGDAAWSESDPFTGVFSRYWTSDQVDSLQAWSVNTAGGWIAVQSKVLAYAVWPVREELSRLAPSRRGD